MSGGEWLTLRRDGVEFKMLNLVEFVWIIEHETQGLYRGFDDSRASNEWKPRWLRGDKFHRRHQDVWKTYSADDARREILSVIKFHKDAYLVRMKRTR